MHSGVYANIAGLAALGGTHWGAHCVQVPLMFDRGGKGVGIRYEVTYGLLNDALSLR